jgi:hypothetical protein
MGGPVAGCVGVTGWLCSFSTADSRLAIKAKLCHSVSRALRSGPPIAEVAGYQIEREAILHSGNCPQFGSARNKWIDVNFSTGRALRVAATCER